MAEEKPGEVQPKPSDEKGAGEKGPETPETLAADVQAQLSALRQELADQKVQREADRRSMQGKIDKDIARERAQAGERNKATQAYLRAQMEKSGAEPEELAAFEQDLDRFQEGLSDKEMASRYKEMVATTEEERTVVEYQDRYIKRIGQALGVEIPANHPDLKREFSDDPEEFEASVVAVAKSLIAGDTKAKDKAALEAAGEGGALSSLGGGAGGGKTNPLQGINDPDELHEIWVKGGRKIPQASD